METAEQVYLAIQHAGLRLRALDAELGLSASRFSVLARLRYGPSASVSELARAEHVAQPTMTKLVDGLVGAGLVARAPDATDRRRVIIELTPDGRALVRRACARKIAWVKATLSHMNERERATLTRAARTIDDVALHTVA